METIYISKVFDMHPFIHSFSKCMLALMFCIFYETGLEFSRGVCYCKFLWRVLTHEVSLQSALRSPS